MLRLALYSLLGLLLAFIVARSLGLTPEQVEAQILLADLNAREGLAFREANAARPGVISLASGLQLQVLEAGAGAVPGEDDWVEVHYRGWHIDGREFDASRRRGQAAVIPVSRAIPGWREALTAAPVGSRLHLVVPPELAYGRAGGGRIGPEETLVFEVELLGIVEPKQAFEPPEWEKPVPGLR
jgi:FKBP-type peptidyl-prolyl cis-trans isomerase FkpA/FKBP-type peptidyl-prolyl cis-trans isomerase FklB